MERGALSYGEHAFEFEKFEEVSAPLFHHPMNANHVTRKKFADESTLQTCMLYLEGYRDFSHPEQMKRIVSLMHRQAIKAKSEGLFFKVRCSIETTLHCALTLLG